jgi:hypothetical protein
VKAVVENRRIKVEILPNMWIRLNPKDVKSATQRVILFRNPISGLNCLARLE